MRLHRRLGPGMVQRLSSLPGLVVALSCFLRCGAAAQYDSCEGTLADIGNGRCDTELNAPPCGYDGGDCCPCTCVDGAANPCSDSDSDCLYPDCDASLWSAVPSYDVADDLINYCDEYLKNDGRCDFFNNNVGCDYDGGGVSRVAESAMDDAACDVVSLDDCR